MHRKRRRRGIITTLIFLIAFGTMLDLSRTVLTAVSARIESLPPRAVVDSLRVVTGLWVRVDNMILAFMAGGWIADYQTLVTVAHVFGERKDVVLRVDDVSVVRVMRFPPFDTYIRVTSLRDEEIVEVPQEIARVPPFMLRETGTDISIVTFAKASFRGDEEIEPAGIRTEPVLKGERAWWQCTNQPGVWFSATLLLEGYVGFAHPFDHWETAPMYIFALTPTASSESPRAGCSGSPVFDRAGYVAGMVAAVGAHDRTFLVVVVRARDILRALANR